jgi:hypothetical protein
MSRFQSDQPAAPENTFLNVHSINSDETRQPVSFALPTISRSLKNREDLLRSTQMAGPDREIGLPIVKQKPDDDIPANFYLDTDTRAAKRIKSEPDDGVAAANPGVDGLFHPDRLRMLQVKHTNRSPTPSPQGPITGCGPQPSTINTIPLRMNRLTGQVFSDDKLSSAASLFHDLPVNSNQNDSHLQGGNEKPHNGRKLFRESLKMTQKEKSGFEVHDSSGKVENEPPNYRPQVPDTAGGSSSTTSPVHFFKAVGVAWPPALPAINMNIEKYVFVCGCTEAATMEEVEILRINDWLQLIGSGYVDVLTIELILKLYGHEGVSDTPDKRVSYSSSLGCDRYQFVYCRIFSMRLYLLSSSPKSLVTASWIVVIQAAATGCYVVFSTPLLALWWSLVVRMMVA